MRPSLFSGESKQENCFIDRFEGNQPAGRVIGHAGPNGIVRQGVDKEGVIAVDNGALRIQTIIQRGWAREGIFYGPYQRENGLTFAVSITNGHNTAQSQPLGVSFKRRMGEWARGSHTWPLHIRFLQWLRYPRKTRTFGLWRWWWAMARQQAKGQSDNLDENLAIGWFPNQVPQDPRTEGSAFIVHATNDENGELWALAANAAPPLIRGLQNIHMYYIVVLREQGAAYYAASTPETPYLPGFPRMRPLAIDYHCRDAAVYAGLFQSLTGQIGFRADTRVRDAQVTKVEGFSNWYGSACAADKLQGEGPLEGRMPDKGLPWNVLAGDYQRTSRGCRPVEKDSLAIFGANEPVGLIHVLVDGENEFGGALRLIWRCKDAANYWAWEIGEAGSRLLIVLQGETTILAQEDHRALEPGRTHSLQILDDGSRVQLILNGKPVCASKICDARLSLESRVGIANQGTDKGFYFSSIEVHPRELPIPDEIQLRQTWTPADERVVIAQDCFEGQAGDLAGRATPVGNYLWQREIGNGVIELKGDRTAVVRGSRDNPNPGRTAYMIPWQDPKNADLELEFIPPGSGARQWEMCRTGFIFYQDADNYIIFNAWVNDFDEFGSCSSFYRIDGFEEIFDALWTNIGKRIAWGVPSTVRVVMEGVNFAVFVNGEAVLSRSLTDIYPDIRDFTIRKVGIIVNWEWGNDTGTILQKFTASHKGQSPETSS